MHFHLDELCLFVTHQEARVNVITRLALVPSHYASLPFCLTLAAEFAPSK